jgi:DNA-binding NtrC family response regulator
MTTNSTKSKQMNPQGMNLFIVDDNKLMVTGLKQYLYNRFGKMLNISTFHTGESCLEKVDQNTNLVILDYFLDGKNGNDILKSIKLINPKTEVIILSSNEDIGTAIESFHQGATDYVVKNDKAWKKIIPHVYRSITEPIRKLAREYGFSKFMAIFLFTFILMGLAVLFVLKVIPR